MGAACRSSARVAAGGRQPAAAAAAAHHCVTVLPGQMASPKTKGLPCTQASGRLNGEA